MYWVNENIFKDFLRLHLVGFGQNIQHGQYTDILEVSSCFLIYLADVEELAQTKLLLLIS